jgi:hypothetical protein
MTTVQELTRINSNAVINIINKYVDINTDINDLILAGNYTNNWDFIGEIFTYHEFKNIVEHVISQFVKDYNWEDILWSTTKHNIKNSIWYDVRLNDNVGDVVSGYMGIDVNILAFIGIPLYSFLKYCSKNRISEQFIIRDEFMETNIVYKVVEYTIKNLDIDYMLLSVDYLKDIIRNYPVHICEEIYHRYNNMNLMKLIVWMIDRGDEKITGKLQDLGYLIDDDIIAYASSINFISISAGMDSLKYSN